MACSGVPITSLPAPDHRTVGGQHKVTVPYAGVVTQVLVDEGSQVQRGHAMCR